MNFFFKVAGIFLIFIMFFVVLQIVVTCINVMNYRSREEPVSLIQIRHIIHYLQ